MTKRLIIFLVRKRLGLKEYQYFRFTNQASDAKYYFTKTNVMKEHRGLHRPSNVSLNWLLNDECSIIIDT